jgi:hypothetical protein
MKSASSTAQLHTYGQARVMPRLDSDARWLQQIDAFGTSDLADAPSELRKEQQQNRPSLNCPITVPNRSLQGSWERPASCMDCSNLQAQLRRSSCWVHTRLFTFARYCKCLGVGKS